MRLKSLALFAGLLLTALSTCFGATVGDVAPGIAIERWIKGTPVQIGAGSNVFVVEFWATWCPPCKESIPHLNELHRKYASKGVIIIGISEEKPATVSSFVAAQGEGMAYRVAVDTSHRTFSAWATAYGHSGIPCAFVVDRSGKVAWHGSPANIDPFLEPVIEGKHDLTLARTLDIGDRAIELYKKYLESPRDKAKAADMAEKILGEYARNWRVPHRLAKMILTSKTIRSRDYALALRATTKAVEMVKGQSGDALDMHARALFLNGKKEEAVAAQRQALTFSDDPQDKADMEKRLAAYEKKP